MRTSGSEACVPSGVILFGSYFAIFLSPFVSYFNILPGFQAWMIFPFFVLPFFVRGLRSIRLHELFLLLIVFYAFISWAFFSIYHGEYNFSSLALFSVSAISFLICLKVFSRSDWQHLDRFYIALALMIFIYGIFQYISYRLNIGVIPENLYRGRSTGAAKQITSIFDEPAFLGLFCISFLYYCLFVRYRLSLFLIACCLAVVVLSKSLSAMVSSAVLVGCFVFLGTDISINKKLRAVFILVPASVFAIIYLDIFEIVRRRFVNEVFNSLVFLSPEYLGYIDNSGQARILGELNYFIHVFKNSSLFGYGIEYNVLLSTYDVERQMALNGFVEIFIRWGVFGLGIFFIFIFFEKLIYKPKSNFVFFIFVALYLTSDGAVSKIEYWLPIALVLAFERIRSNFALVNK